MKKYLAFLIIFTTMIIMSCGPRGKKTEIKIGHTVAVVTVNQSTVTRSVELFGSIYGERQVTVTPKIMGRVTQIVKPEGSAIKENDTILYILNDISGMDYKPGPVLSPISGIVGKIYVDIGQTVAQTMPVATIASYSENVKVKAPISDQDLPYVKRGTPAYISVSAISNGTFEGKVTNVSTVVDQVSGSATVEVTLSNRDKKLIPGMACNIKLEIEKKSDVIALPLSALFTDGFSKVLVTDNKNIAHFREIKVGLIGSEFVEITSGLNIGEKVVTTGKERVSDGDEVKTVEGAQ